MLQFVLGKILSDKLTWTIQDIQNTLADSKIQTVYYLVPDHIKFDTELAIYDGLGKDTASGISGSIQVQVYSFSRLAWYLLKDTGLLSKKQLSQTGLSMLVRHILKTHGQDLRVYRGELKKPGFIKQLTELFMEMRGGNIEAQQLAIFANSLTDKQLESKQKIAELRFLYEQFNAQLIGQYIEKEDLYHLLAEHIRKLDNLADSVVYIHGFERFTARELAVVEALMGKVSRMVVSLPLDTGAMSEKQVPNAIRYVPEKTYRHLRQLAQAKGIRLEKNVLLETGFDRYSQGIQDLIAYWEAVYLEEKVPLNQPLSKQDSLFIQEYANKQEEVSQVVKQISDLVASGQYRYKDIYVFMRQVEDYELILKPLLKESQIPYFLDNAESMAYHPLAEWLAALYAIQKHNWQYSDIMRFLRTELSSLNNRPAIDLLENELLAKGYQTLYWWEHEEAWENQALRQDLVNLLVPYFKELDQAETMQEAAGLLYRFCQSSGLMDQVLLWRQKLIDQGRLEEARQHEQVWQTFIGLLDEFVTILGTAPFDKDEFYTVLLDGFEQAEYHVAPASLDSVTIASLDARRLNPKKIAFVLGASRSQFPMTYEEKSLLTAEERKGLSETLEAGRYLSLEAQYRTFVEPFVAYQLFASAKERLYIFYHLQEDLVSPYVELLRGHFQTNPIAEARGRLRPLFRDLLTKVRQSFDGEYQLTQTDKALLAYLSKQADWAPLYQKLMASFTFKNTPKQLQLAPDLYEGDLYLSVSQLESYFKDPYSHFLQYGLRLQERAVLELTAADIGNVFHDTLDIFYGLLQDQKMHLSQLDNQAVERLAQTSLEQVFAKPENRIFGLSKTMAFSRLLLSDTMKAVIREWHGFSQQVKMETLATEYLFSSRSKAGLYLPSLSLAQGRQLHLRGKIDRMDRVEGQYLSLIDYKSGDKSFHWQDFYEGTALQLLTYLYVMDQNQEWFGQKESKLMGAFYYHVTNKYEKVEDLDLPQEALVHEASHLRGLLSIPATDMQTIDSDGQVYKVAFKKDGQYKAGTMPLVSEQDLPVLFAFLKAKMVEAGNRILSGDIRLAPVEEDAYIPSLTTYRAVSLFDATLPENRYRKFEKLENVIEEIKKKVGDTSDATS